MNNYQYKILLADDDDDDCIFFEEALEESSCSTALSIVNDGVELMHFLEENSKEAFPDILFLDLNMPRKNGIECLTEINKSEKFKDIAVIIFTTSFDSIIIDELYDKGAIHYIRKPGDFNKLRKVIENAILLAVQNDFKQPSRDQFVLQT